MNKKMYSIKKYYQTIKYLKPIQIYSRLKMLLAMRLYKFFPRLTKLIFYDSLTKVHLRGSSFLPGLTEANLQELEYCQIIVRAESVITGLFTFLNHSVKFSSLDLIEWNSPKLAQLWRFNLHYFDYAWDLGIAYLLSSDKKYYTCFKSIVNGWIKHNRIGVGDGWHPYTISLRLVNWIYCYHLFKSALDTDQNFKTDLLTYIYCQAKYLNYNLEYHLLGNHLLENGRALVFAGLFFQGNLANDWLKKGSEILWSQAEEQILMDGGHFELSPMYHSIVLWNYLECINLLRINKQSVPDRVVTKVDKMLEFQKRILHPDRKNPLFNDTALDMGPDPSEVLHFGSVILKKDFGITDKPSCKLKCILGNKLADVKSANLNIQSLESFKDSGYYILRNSTLNSFLIIKCGKPCPDYLPGHAHADMLSYELSLNNERFIVDSGVYEYKQGKYRDFFRSTKAHNTLTVNDQNQCDVWGSFRIGQRGNPLEAKLDQQNLAKIFKGTHDSYYNRYGIIHTRYLSEIHNSFWLVVDEMNCKNKMNPTYKFCSYIHFHPRAAFDGQFQNTLNLKFNGYPVQLLLFGSKNIEINVIVSKEPVFSYSPRFGEFESKLTLKLSLKDNKPAVLGYVILPFMFQNSLGKFEFVYQSFDNYRLIIAFQATTWEYYKTNDSIKILQFPARPMGNL